MIMSIYRSDKIELEYDSSERVYLLTINDTYGHYIDTVKLDKEEFIGKEALAQQKAEGPKQRVVGIELKDKAVPRHGYAVLFEGEKIGEVTTGYNSISTGKSVCMALVDAAHGKLGTELEVQIRKKTFAGVVVKKRFYDKHYKK